LMPMLFQKWNAFPKEEAHFSPVTEVRVTISNVAY